MSKPGESFHERSVPDVLPLKWVNNVIPMGSRWWSTWQERSVNRRIFAAMLTVSGLSRIGEAGGWG